MPGFKKLLQRRDLLDDVRGIEVIHVSKLQLDVDLDLYHQRITLDFIARLRDEQRFAGIDALKTQIASDVLVARQILQKEA